MASETLQEAWSKLQDEIVTFAEKVQPIFEANNWTWGTVGGVPSQINIESTLYSLVWETYQEIDKKDSEHSCCGTGRLQVRFNKYASGWMGTIELVPECRRV